MKLLNLEEQRNKNLNLEKKFSSSEKLVLKKFEFICTNCKTIHRFELLNGVFRSLDYYCNSCGHRHKVVNPAFSTTSGVENQESKNKKKCKKLT